MIVTIRNVSRFGLPLLAAAWFVSLIVGVGFIAPGAIRWVMFPWFIIGALFTLLFRCPRCHASTVSSTGRFLGAYLAPFWTPTHCQVCQLDFRDKTFWSPGNRRLRSDWLLLTSARNKRRG